MAYEQRELTGALFKNKKRTEPDSKLPNLTGKCKIDGVDYYVDAWTKEPKEAGGDRWISLSFKAVK